MPKWLGDRMSDYKMGELWITPESCTITYSETVKNVRGLDPPRNKASVPEPSSGAPYLHDTCEPLMAADMNGCGAMVGTNGMVAKFDFTQQISRVPAARRSSTLAYKLREVEDDLRYDGRHRRKKTNHTVEAKRGRRRKLHGGDKLRNKLGHRLRNARKARKSELAGISVRQGAETRKLKSAFEGSESDLKRRKDAWPARAAGPPPHGFAGVALGGSSPPSPVAGCGRPVLLGCLVGLGYGQKLAGGLMPPRVISRGRVCAGVCRQQACQAGDLPALLCDGVNAPPQLPTHAAHNAGKGGSDALRVGIPV